MSTEEKTAYLAELRRLLATLPAEERETALIYYEEYFDDAGAEETERVLGELGPARALAEQILSGYSRDYLDAQPVSAHRRVPARPEDVGEARRREEEARAEAAKKQAGEEKAKHATPPPRRGGPSVLLIIFLTILALPLLLPLAALIFALLVGLAALVFGLSLGMGGVVVAMLVSGMVVLVVGFSLLAVHTLEALLACGVGLALMGAGMILTLLCVFMLVKVVPAVLRFMLRILRWPFERRVARA